MKERLCTWGSMTALMGAFCVAPCFAQSLTWLGTLDYRSSIATDVSDDGSVVVGIAYTPNFDFRAFYWRNGRMEPIAPPRWLGWSQAYGVSGDGNVVVGDMMDSVGYMVAFKWTPSAGLEFLGALGGVGGIALAASYDGSTIVGWAETRDEQRLAFRWRQGQGMRLWARPRERGDGRFGGWQCRDLACQSGGHGARLLLDRGNGRPDDDGLRGLEHRSERY
jgi:probable HAF family extracellular repeat protein